MAFELIPFAITVALFVLAFLILRFIVKSAITLLKVAIIVLFAVGIYFLFTTFIG